MLGRAHRSDFIVDLPSVSNGPMIRTVFMVNVGGSASRTAAMRAGEHQGIVARGEAGVNRSLANHSEVTGVIPKAGTPADDGQDPVDVVRLSE